jgi:hypothetical protein
MLAGNQQAQTRTTPLGDLAVLLRRPAKVRAELAGTQVQLQLADQHEPLVMGELARSCEYAGELLTAFDYGLGACPRIGNFDGRGVGVADRQRPGQRCLNRAATAQGPMAVGDARAELLLKRVGYVVGTLEGSAAARPHQQLKRGLAEAVLQILVPQSAAVGTKQHRALLGGHACDLLGGVHRGG